MMRRRDAYVVALAWCVFILCGTALWYIGSNGNWESAYGFLVPLLIVGFTASAYWVLLSSLCAAVLLFAWAFDAADSVNSWFRPTVYRKQDPAQRKVRLAWLALVICLANAVWVYHYFPPWNQLDRPSEIELQSGMTVLGLSLGIALLTLMVISQWWILPSIGRWLILGRLESMRRHNASDAGAILGYALALFIAACSAFCLWSAVQKTPVMRTDPDLLPAMGALMLPVLGVLILAWLLFQISTVHRPGPRVFQDEETLARGRPGESRNMLEFTELAKDLILDMQIPESQAWRPPALDLPPLDLAQFKAAMGPKLDELLKRAAEILARSSARSPAFRQLLRDFEHELTSVAQRVQLDSAFASFPPPAGHWAERYRRMIEAEHRVSRHSESNPSQN